MSLPCLGRVPQGHQRDAAARGSWHCPRAWARSGAEDMLGARLRTPALRGRGRKAGVGRAGLLPRYLLLDLSTEDLAPRIPSLALGITLTPPVFQQSRDLIPGPLSYVSYLIFPESFPHSWPSVVCPAPLQQAPSSPLLAPLPTSWGSFLKCWVLLSCLLTEPTLHPLISSLPPRTPSSLFCVLETNTFFPSQIF